MDDPLVSLLEYPPQNDYALVFFENILGMEDHSFDLLEIGNQDA